MKYENLEQAKAVCEKIDDLKNIRNKMDAEQLTIHISESPFARQTFMNISASDSQADFNGFAVELATSIKRALELRIEDLFKELELL